MLPPLAEVPLTEEQKAAVIKTYTQEFKTDYKYVAQINTKASYSTKEVDLNGTVEGGRRPAATSSASSVESQRSGCYERSFNVDGDSLEVSKDAPVVTFDGCGMVGADLRQQLSPSLSMPKIRTSCSLVYPEKPVSSIID